MQREQTARGQSLHSYSRPPSAHSEQNYVAISQPHQARTGVPLTIMLPSLTLACFVWLSCFLSFGKWHAKGDSKLTHLALPHPRVAITIRLVCIQAPIVCWYVCLQFQLFGSQCGLTSDISVPTGRHGSALTSKAPGLTSSVAVSDLLRFTAPAGAGCWLGVSVVDK